MPPIISIVGESKSGKTTLIEMLISELKSRGYRVATIKHSIHSLSFDKPGKDTWRHIQAGSSATAIVSPDKFVLIKPVSKEPDLNEIARLLGDEFDIVLTEGFKQSQVPKIEVHRKAAGPSLNRVNNLIAIATDEPLETETSQFPLNDIKGLVDFLENSYIRSK
jgi:molybdopterin-guanine dinucleotide biosynthesis protein MobB